DLSKLFFKCMLCNAMTGTSEYYFINASQIPKSVLPAFKSKITLADIEEGKLPREQRMKLWRSQYGRVYEVTSLIPLKIIGMKATEFMRKYREPLKNIVERHLATTHLIHSSHGENNLKVKTSTTREALYIKGDEILKNREEIRHVVLAANTMFQTEDLY